MLIAAFVLIYLAASVFVAWLFGGMCRLGRNDNDD
jgi:hypothetical protein